MAKVFITGIEGFVGTHLARHLAMRGYQVSGIFFVTPVGDLSFARVSYCDICNAAQLRNLLAQEQPEFIIHLAAVSSVVIAEQDFAGALRVNVEGTLNLLAAVHQLQLPCRVLVISSSEVYDRRAPAGRLDESAPVCPLNNYAFTKLQAEQLALYFVRRHDLDLVILRPFSHTGPGQSTNFVFPSIARQIAEAELGRRAPEIQVGNIDVSRDYTDVRDICRAYELALTRTVKGETYNVTSEHLLRIGEGINYLLSLARVPVKLKVQPERQRVEAAMLAGSSAKFRQATGWRPEIDIHQTLTDVLEYQRRVVRDIAT